MRTYFFTTIALGLLIGAGLLFVFYKDNTVTFVKTALHKPCATPIAYRIGTIDARFGLSKETIVEKLATASALWSDAYGKPLFVYAPSDSSALPINFIYDRRQQTLALGSAIDSTEAAQQEARQEVLSAQAAHTKAEQSYAASVEALNAESRAYSKEVQEVNARGGATPEEYKRLNAEKEALNEKQSVLEAQGAALTREGKDLQVMIDSYNAKVSDINKVVQNYNAAAGGDFEEGQYVQDATGKRIDIYAYKNQAELLHSLTHELGHALGLNHNQNASSIMFPYNKSGVTLSKDDIADLMKVCGNT